MRDGALGVADTEALRALPIAMRVLSRGEDVFRQGSRPSECCLVLEGMLSQYKVLDDGRRQIISVHLAGEIADVTGLHHPVADHGLGAVIPSRVGLAPRAALSALTRQHPAIALAIWRHSQDVAAIYREWMINVGRRSAYERLAHLFCELMVRMRSAGVADGDRFTLWLTQADLADVLGLSTVHVNRSMQLLKAAGLIRVSQKCVRIPDWPALCEAAGFDESYLHAPGRL